MEREEEDRQKVFNLAKPVLENYQKHSDHLSLICDHLETLKILSSSSDKLDTEVYNHNVPLKPVQEEHLETLSSLVDSFTQENDNILKECSSLRSRHKDAFKTYEDCLRKLNRFNINMNDEEKDTKVSKSDKDRVVLIVKRMQSSHATLALASTECQEKLSELLERQESSYKEFKEEFLKARELMFRKTAEHLHLEIRQ